MGCWRYRVQREENCDIVRVSPNENIVCGGFQQEDNCVSGRVSMRVEL